MKREYVGLDFIKVFAAVGIVGIHANVPIINTFGRLGVPYFAIVSSFLFFSKYNHLPELKRYRYALHFTKRIMYLFFAWELIYLPSAYVYLRMDMNNYGTRGLLNFIFHFFFPPFPLTNGWGQSWYLIGIAIAVPLIVILSHYFSKLVLGFVCLLLCLFYLWYSNQLLFNVSVHLPHFLYWFLGPFGSSSFPILAIYAFIGLILSNYKSIELNKLNKCLIVNICILLLIVYGIENVILWFTTNNGDSAFTLLTIPTAVTLTFLGLILKVRMKNYMFWRQFSTFLYCIHIGIIHCFAILKLYCAIKINSFIIFFLTIIISFGIYCIYYLLKSKYYLKWLNIFV